MKRVWQVTVNRLGEPKATRVVGYADTERDAERMQHAETLKLVAGPDYTARAFVGRNEHRVS